MTTWDALYPLVLPEVPTCPFPTVDQQLVLAAREYCERTAVWTEWADPVAAAGGASTFEFDIGSNAELVRVVTAALGTEDLRVMSAAELPPGWQSDAAERRVRRPASLIVMSSTEYLITPEPIAGAVISLRLALKPTLRARQCADLLVTEHGEAIAAGAGARLLSLPRTEFRDPARAAEHRAAFETAVHLAANRQLRRTDQQHRRVRSSPF